MVAGRVLLPARHRGALLPVAGGGDIRGIRHGLGFANFLLLHYSTTHSHATEHMVPTLKSAT